VPICFGFLKHRLQYQVPSNCLTKTQVSAKLKNDVWGLTPAQCQMVKEVG